MFITQLYHKGDNRWFKYMISFILALGALFLGQIVSTVGLFGLAAANGIDMSKLSDPYDILNFEKMGIHPALGLFIMVVGFAITLIIMHFLIKPIHDRPALTSYTARPRLDWSRVFYGFGIWALLNIGVEGISYFISPSEYTLTTNWSGLFLTAIVAILFIPFQTTCEELLFRGHFLQAVSLGTKSRALGILIMGSLFGLMHMGNPEVAEYGNWLFFYYAGVGWLLGIITLMDDGIEIAMGMHAANNIMGATLLSHDSSVFQTPTLLKVAEIDMFTNMFAWYIFGAIFLFLCARKYKWNNWTKLTAKIEAPALAEQHTAE